MRSAGARSGYIISMRHGKEKSDRDYLLGRMDRFLRLRSSCLSAGCSCELRFPSLTVSRQCGAGLSRLERPLLEYLDGLDDTEPPGWALFDQALLGRLVEERRIGHPAPPLMADRAKFALSPMLCEQLAKPPREWTLFNHSANAIRHLCRAGNALIVGRAGNHVTADLPNTFHVRLVAEKDKRVAYVAKHYRIDVKEADEIVDETDKARARFVKRHAGGEIDDPTAYHLVLNTNHFDDEIAVRVIADSLHEWSQLRHAGADRTALPPSDKVIEGKFPAVPS